MRHFCVNNKIEQKQKMVILHYIFMERRSNYFSIIRFDVACFYSTHVLKDDE